MSENTKPAEEWEKIQQSVADIREQTARVIVGQEAIVEEMLVSLLCKGHCLITGVPGLAKTLLVSTLGRILGLKFNRIQFTPDLMPTDIVGSEILQNDAGTSRGFEFVEEQITLGRECVRLYECGDHGVNCVVIRAATEIRTGDRT